MAGSDSGCTMSSQNVIKVATCVVTVLVISELIFLILYTSDRRLEVIWRYGDQLIGGIRETLELHTFRNCTTIVIMKSKNETMTTKPKMMPICPSTPPSQVGCLRTYHQGPPLKELQKLLDYLSPGGRYTPDTCVTDQRVAVVIPYRNRELQLRTVLYNLHLMLPTQQLDYGIFLVEQAGNNTFNRGMLMNIGFAEATKTYNYTCFVFHDVDLIPEDDRIYYGCGPNPRHLSVAIDKFHYRVPEDMPDLLGGVTQLPRAAIEKINGFSNLYFGWGGEDDDLSIRIRNADLTVERQSISIARYRMIKHLHENSNAPNTERFELLENAIQRIDSDGLNTLRYRVLHKTEEKLYTNITVEIKEEDYYI